MSIESAIEGLTGAVQANTAAILKAVGAPVPAPESAPKPGRPKKEKAAETKKTGITKDDIKAQTILAAVDHKLAEPVRALLTRMGVQKATELAESQYEEYMNVTGKLIIDAIAAKKAADGVESFV